MGISPILFCRTAKLVRSTLPCEKRCAGKVFRACGERTSPRCFSANALYPSRLKDEPRQGFISVLFLRGKPLLSCVLRRAVTGFYKRTIFGVGGRDSVFNSRHHNIIISNSLPTEPITQIPAWCMSTRELVRKKCFPIASAS